MQEVLKVVDDLGLVWALVDFIGDAVAVVVGIRAAVSIVMAVAVLGHRPAAVVRIDHAIAVGVGSR